MEEDRLGLAFVLGVNGLGGVLSSRSRVVSSLLRGLGMADEPVAIVSLDRALYHTTLKEVRAYEDLVSAQKDLEMAAEFVAESIRLHGTPTTITAALFSASHMSYRRCFNRGNGGLGKGDLAALSASQRETHDYHYAQADKLIAHSVNRHDSVYAGLAVNAGKVGVGFLAVRMTGLDKPDAERWLELIRFILERVMAPKVQAAFNTAITRAQKIPYEDVLRSKVIRGETPTRANAAKARGR